ncbi:hypothetical protein Clacol_004435 [Clathrus columnatus]|uniref:Uncharacterized protein n=1 Tax=Clathrus columnatus TaxID=1419009 RepID=A0AAV5ABW7_9AGAM|nr:hypothetical protein Clacol_004435 [Clathrus columnatus]
MSENSLCNDLGFSIDAMGILSLVGVQVRTLALCHGYRPMTIALSTTFFTAVILAIYAAILTLILVGNIATVLLDLLAFIAVLYQVWSLWKEKRKLGLHTDKDFVTLLLRQGKSTLIKDIGHSKINLLSVTLICEFTQDLRRRNAARSLPNQSSLELPDLNFLSQANRGRSIQSVFGRLQESIIADMGERNDPVGNIDDPGQGEPDPEIV